MDGSRFDMLTKRLVAAPLTRATALRRLAASAAALAGLRLAAESGEAAKKKAKKVKVCNCANVDATTCRTTKVKKPKLKKFLKKHACAYRGKCQPGVSGCAAGGGVPLSCRDGAKNGTETDVDCGGGSCPRCQGGQICNSRNDCHTALCTGGTCQSCAAANDCGLDSDGDMCFCRDNAAQPGERMCTRQTCNLFTGGTCANCAAGEQCAPAGPGAIECCTPCGA